MAGDAPQAGFAELRLAVIAREGGRKKRKAGSNPGLFSISSFRGDAKRRTRNLEIPDVQLHI